MPTAISNTPFGSVYSAGSAYLSEEGAVDHTRFDDLTRSLATSVSRRQVLRLLGGSLLAAFVPERVLAGGGNSNCAKFCAQVFGAHTPAADKCTSDAAHQTGL